MIDFRCMFMNAELEWKLTTAIVNRTIIVQTSVLRDKQLIGLRDKLENPLDLMGKSMVSG